MEDGMVMEPVDTGSEVEIDASEVEAPVESTEQVETQTENDDPYSSKASREYSQWLKALREEKANDPVTAKFARVSKDNHARLYQLQQMEPRGIDGVREKYALLDSLTHGELKGVDAIGALQDELRGVQEIDEQLFAGNAEALKEMGDEFISQALPKLAGPILEMVRESNPDAYAAAVLPHFVEALKSSELVSSFNGLVDVLNQAPPSWLTPDQKTAWTQDKIQQITGLAGKMGAWFNAQQAKAGELPKNNGQITGKSQGNPTREATELETLRKEQQTQHWNNNIKPGLDKHAEMRFSEQFRAYAKRLKLDAAATNDLKENFIKGVVGKASQNKAYTDQIGRYRAQKNPDPNTVLNFAKVEFDKHAKTVMDALVNQRYKPFLSGGQKPAIPAGGGAKAAFPSAGVQVVAIKPTNIDYKNTPLEWMHQKKYRTTDGKIVQVRN